MLFNAIVKNLFEIVKFFFNFIYLPDFNLGDTFGTYITWFNTFLDDVTSLIAFLIPRGVFISSIIIVVFIAEFDNIMMIIKFLLGFIPFIGNGINKKE